MFKIDKEFKDLIFALSENEFKQLEKNILEEGIRDKLVTWQNVLIDGHNRYVIANKHNLQYETIEKEFDNRDEVKNWIIDNQLGRRNITAMQRDYLLGLRYKQEKKSYGGNRKTESSTQSGNLKKTAEKIADEQGVSKNTVIRAEKITKGIDNIAKYDLELKKDILQGKTDYTKQDISSFSEIDIEEEVEKRLKKIEEEKLLKRKQKRKIIENKINILKQKEIEKCNGKYDVIVIDPPWQMEKIEREVAPNQVGFDYPTMSIEEIKEFELPNEKDCHVFMWITQKHHKYGWDIFERWGVRFICEFVWHKNGGFQPFNLPQFNHEYVMYGRIGSPVFTELKNFFTCFSANRTGHSKKPDEFYEVIRRVTAGKKIDIFNRRKIEGFDVWGNEA